MIELLKKLTCPHGDKEIELTIQFQKQVMHIKSKAKCSVCGKTNIKHTLPTVEYRNQITNIIKPKKP